MKKAIFSFAGVLVGMGIAAELLQGITFDKMETVVFAGLVLGAVYLIVRPILRIVSLPLNIITVGLFYVVLDAALLWFATSYYDTIHIESFGVAVFAAVIVNVSRGLFGMLAGRGK